MRTILLIILSICSTLPLSAQETLDNPSEPIKQGLSRFHSIDVDAPIKLTLINIGEYDVPYIVYDTKNVFTSKFSFEVGKDGVLKIRERHDPKRETITEVWIYYNSIKSLDISKADVVAEGVIEAHLLDISASNDSHLIAEIKSDDLKINITGKCCVEINGEALYQTADISTATYNAINLKTMSSSITASHNADVSIDATQRLIIKTSTGAKICYKSHPEIYREDISLFGGEVTQL